MRTSTDRILTTHVGSLPRRRRSPTCCSGASTARSPDRPGGAQVIADATEEVVKRQVAAGVDVVSDGEMSKISYATYVADRFTGFDGDTPRSRAGPGRISALLEKLAKLGSTAKYRRPRCVGEIRTKTSSRCRKTCAISRAAWLRVIRRTPSSMRRHPV
jgi:5-methyltetrahydropteroyltriglutamate--homocysteine methyltransferase